MNYKQLINLLHKSEKKLNSNFEDKLKKIHYKASIALHLHYEEPYVSIYISGDYDANNVLKTVDGIIYAIDVYLFEPNKKEINEILKEISAFMNDEESI